LTYVRVLTKLNPEEYVTTLCQFFTFSSIFRWQSEVETFILTFNIKTKNKQNYVYESAVH